MQLTFIHTAWFGQRVPSSLGSFSHVSHSSYFTLHCNFSFSVVNITNHSQITSNVSSCYKTYSIYALCFYITHNQQPMTTSATVNSRIHRSHPSANIHIATSTVPRETRRSVPTSCWHDNSRILLRVLPNALYHYSTADTNHSCLPTSLTRFKFQDGDETVWSKRQMFMSIVVPSVE